MSDTNPIPAPDTTVLIDAGAWKIKLGLGVAGLFTLIALAFMYRLEFGVIVLGGGIVGILRGLLWVNTMRHIERLNRRRMEATTRIIELKADILAQKVSQEAERVDQLRLKKLIVETRVGVFRFPAPDVEPVYIPASASERKSLPLAVAAPQTQATPIDFFSVLTDPKAVYAIIGPQRTGKSYVAMHLTDHLTANDLGLCLFIGVKAEPGEWPNCRQYIGEAAISRALRNLIAMVDDRHQRQVRQPRINVFLDDWINVVATAGDLAEKFFMHAATNMLSAGIVPYFLLQSDSNSDWGNSHGAQLKNNFTKLVLKPTRRAGKIIPTETKAVVIFPGERQEHPVNLPSGLPRLGIGQPQHVRAQTPAPEPTPEEAQIISLKQQGFSDKQTSESVWGDGKFGSFYNKKIEAVLIKHGLEVRNNTIDAF